MHKTREEKETLHHSCATKVLFRAERLPDQEDKRGSEDGKETGAVLNEARAIRCTVVIEINVAQLSRNGRTQGSYEFRSVIVPPTVAVVIMPPDCTFPQRK